MPTILKRTSKITGEITYQAKVRVRGCPPQTQTFKTKTHAKEWAQRTEADMRENKHFPHAKAKKHTIADLIDKYLEHLQAKNPQRYRDVKPLLGWWKTELKDKTLAHFRGEDVLDGQQKLMSRKRQRKDAEGKERTLSPATVNRYMVALHTAIQFGVKPLKWIAVNPVNEVDKLKEPPGRTRFLSSDELNRLVNACKLSQNPYLFAIVIIGLATGARRDEIRQMKWADVGPDFSFITLPKTKNGDIRSAHLTGVALAIVKQMSEERGNDIFLFPSPNAPSRPIDFESAWRFALQAANIKDFRFHDNRHTCASYLAMNGASLLVIAETLGHKSLQMVKRYAHLTQAHTSSVIGQMTEKVLGHVKL